MALGHCMKHAQQTMRSITPACSPEVGATRRISAGPLAALAYVTKALVG